MDPSHRNELRDLREDKKEKIKVNEPAAMSSQAYICGIGKRVHRNCYKRLDWQEPLRCIAGIASFPACWLQFHKSPRTRTSDSML